MGGRELLESDAMRAFAVFAEHRNFTTAAAALRISQPSLHVKIRKLATGLGWQLYEREGRRLVLTEAGQRLAALAADNARRLDEFLRDLDQAPSTLTVAAGRGTFRWVIPDALRRVSAHGLRIQVVVADRDSAVAALSTGRADVAVIGYDPPPRQLESVPIAEYPQVLVIDAAHPLAQRDQLRLADLDGLDLVVPPADRPHRRALERGLADAGVSWNPVAEADGWDLLVHFAALRIGGTVVNGCVPAPEGLAAVPVTDLPAVRYWAAWRGRRHAGRPDIVEHLLRP
ncbi:LysR family transcriptional regulator [Rugosimonospora africana]|uniref:Transcriptional regulator n=1 Tax=Rugosimonospora africana TaxID=556532 RepID=A0A8J3QR34_9ACTN|nr:LysR family transcriptional regulator [Rugosimonospora africana]GIH14120.1 transcriptional regulator [Rugosimonospora africana]